MTDQSPDRPAGRQDNAFDTDDNYSGQAYSIEKEEAEGARNPSGTVSSRGPDTAADRDGEGEVGKRASFDPATGAVHGSGAGAGGGNPAEDFDSDPKGGGGYPRTGAGDEAPPADSGDAPA